MSPPSGTRVWAIVPAAGRGARFASGVAGLPKQYADLRGATVLQWALRALLREPRIAAVMVPLAADDIHWQRIAPFMPLAESGKSSPSALESKVHTTVGGASRQQSVMNGLMALSGRADAEDWVLVHDAARPCLTSAELTALIDAVECGPAGADGALNGAVLASPLVDTIKRERGGIAVDTVDREGLWRALTPQVFRFAQLRHALEDAQRSGIAVTDEAQAMERLGLPARLVRGSAFNIKVTKPEDLSMAETILKGMEKNRMRTGQGFDVHAFGAGDHVVLAGVRIDHPQGVVAHSDGDVVIHALCDALLGALGLGDIGQHFPDSDPKYRGADSRVFLREVAAHMRAAALTILNADVTVLAEAPRISQYRLAMAQNLAADLGVAPDLINIKATTTERLGFIGRGEGLAASAAVLLDAATASPADNTALPDERQERNST